MQLRRPNRRSPGWTVYLPLLIASVQVFGTEDLLLSVEQLIAAGQYEEALVVLNQTPAPDSRSARWHLLASKVFDGLDDPVRAVREAEVALSLDDKNEAIRLQLAQIFLSRNAPLVAHEVLSEALLIFPDSILIRLGNGLALKELKRYEEAEKELSEVLRRKPDLSLAFDGLSTVYLNTANYDALFSLAQAFHSRNPGDFRSSFYLAQARHSLEMETGPTEVLVREAIRLNPNFAASHALLGRLLLESGRVGEAIEALEKALQLRPDYTPAHLNLIRAYRKAGREQDADRQALILQRLNETPPVQTPSLTDPRPKP